MIKEMSIMTLFGFLTLTTSVYSQSEDDKCGPDQVHMTTACQLYLMMTSDLDMAVMGGNEEAGGYECTTDGDPIVSCVIRKPEHSAYPEDPSSQTVQPLCSPRELEEGCPSECTPSSTGANPQCNKKTIPPPPVIDLAGKVFSPVICPAAKGLVDCRPPGNAGQGSTTTEYPEGGPGKENPRWPSRKAKLALGACCTEHVKNTIRAQFSGYCLNVPESVPPASCCCPRNIFGTNPAPSETKQSPNREADSSLVK